MKLLVYAQASRLVIIISCNTINHVIVANELVPASIILVNLKS